MLKQEILQCKLKKNSGKQKLVDFCVLGYKQSQIASYAVAACVLLKEDIISIKYLKVFFI